MDQAAPLLRVPSGWVPEPKAARLWAIWAQACARDVVELDVFARMLGIGGV